MKIDRITYSESHEQFSDFGLKLWRKVGLEAELQEEDTPEKALIELKQKVNEMLHPITNDLSATSGHSDLKVNQVSRSREETINAHLQTIAECKTIRNLEMFANMVQRENEPTLFEAYNKKKIELQ